MADNNQQNKPRRISIRKLDPPPPPPPVVPPEPQKKEAPLPVQEEVAAQAAATPVIQKRRKPKTAFKSVLADTTTGALFPNAGRCLSYLGSILGNGQVDSADVRKSPNGAFWVEVDAPSRTMAQLVWMAQGRPYKKVGDHWVFVLPVQIELQQEAETIRITDWPEVMLSELLVQAPLFSGRYHPVESLDILAPGALGQTILKRALSQNMQVTVTASQKEPLTDDTQTAAGVLLIQVRAAKGKFIPVTFVNSLVILPYVFVGNAWESGEGRLLIDVRYRAPMSPMLLARLVPAGETWILGAPDDGHWRLLESGSPVEGTTFLEVVHTPVPQLKAHSDVRLPQSLPLSLVHRPGQRKNTDAVLLDDEEIKWLAVLLKNRPIEEMAFLFPGPGRHLLTAPGGLSGTLPVGLPLSWHGPGGFYVELGKDFYPALPETARAAQFALSPDTLVAVTMQATFRFETAQMTPAWNLWVGDAPKVEAGLSEYGERMIRALSGLLQKKEPMFKPVYPTFQFGSIHKMNRLDLLKEAQRAEIAGNLVKAAQLLEQAGYPGPAGRLYERAAGK